MTQYISKFSGHETFPLRYGWLYKAVKLVRETYRHESLKPITSSKADDVERAVVRMGVGKNMVSSIRYWTEMTGLIEAGDSREETSDKLTALATHIFGADDDTKGAASGWDPYMENPATIWFLHWLLNSNYKVVTASRWFFNRFNGQRFDKQQLMDSILSDVDRLGIKAADKTISKDIECFLQGYGQKTSTDKKVSEDTFSSPLAELGLVRILEEGKYKKFGAELGEQESLPSDVFLYALIDFWYQEATDEKTISFDRLLKTEGSPARVFRLSQSALGNRLDDVEILTKGKISWTDTQGLRQIQCHNIAKLNAKKLDYMNHYYAKQGK